MESTRLKNKPKASALAHRATETPKVDSGELKAWNNVADVAAYTGFEQETIYRRVWDGELKAKRFGEGKRARIRISKAAVLAWIESLPDAA